MFETLLQSIQTDEARHAQIGISVLEILVRHDAEYAQYLVDKWFWRSWLFFAVVTGSTPCEERIHGIARVHEHIYQSLDISRLDFCGSPPGVGGCVCGHVAKRARPRRFNG